MSEFTFPLVFPSLAHNHDHRRAIRQGTAFVYVMQDGPHGDIKIGWARDPFARLKRLQTGNSRELRLLYYEDMHDREIAVAAERNLHREFRGHCVRGEWFRFIGSVWALVYQATYERTPLAVQMRSWAPSTGDLPDDHFDDADTFTDDDAEDVA